jgi:hypothetical protein
LAQRRSSILRAARSARYPGLDLHRASSP